MKKSILIPVLLISFSLAAQQRILPSDRKILRQKEDSMKRYALDIVNGINASNRFRSDSIFTRIFVRALKVKNSFYYRFDSLITISNLYAPDSSFRIFTWQVSKDESMIRQHGAIQMNTRDGSLRLFPLFDQSDFTDKPMDSVRDNRNWIGAIYYKIIQKEYNGQRFYTLLGYDENSIRSNKKWIEVLNFTPDGQPRFGGLFFNFAQDSVPRPMQHRFSLEYKKDARAGLNYDEEMDMILFDHLIPENDQADKKFTYIPDGDYEGFQWKDGRWQHIDKVFNFKLKDGEAPVPNPIRNGQGAIDELRLIEQAEKQKAKEKKPPKSGG